MWRWGLPVRTRTPRPARRYRFDRPSKVDESTPVTPTIMTPVATTQARTDENKDIPVRPNNGHMFNGQTSEKEIAVPQSAKQATAVPQQAGEQITAKQPGVQESPAVESTTPPATPPTQEDRRRRHGQDRQRNKEQSCRMRTKKSDSEPIQGRSFLRRFRNQLKRSPKALRQRRKRVQVSSVTWCWSAGSKMLEKM